MCPLGRPAQTDSRISLRRPGTPAGLDAGGRPLPGFALPGTGGGPDDWTSRGIVTVDSDDQVRLNVGVFKPRAGSSEKLFYFSRNPHRHIAAAAANSSAPGNSGLYADGEGEGGRKDVIA